jgi:hypothetical protein
VGAAPLFRSFWLGGFEAAGHITRAGARLDLLAATQHDRQATADYALLPTVGIRAARDAVRWHLVDRGPGRPYDFSPLAPLVRGAQDAGVQVVWTLCHYGWPEDLDVFAPAFVDRFARYCGAVARYVAGETGEAPWYTPINEISFLTWAAGDVGYIFPHARGRGHALKRQLVRAAIAGMEAIRDVDPRARFLHVDPVIHVVPPRDRPDLVPTAVAECHSQLEAWDRLTGRYEPSLGGHAKYMDALGANFYWANQWEWRATETGAWLGWAERPLDDRWEPLHRLLANVHDRYRCPLVIAETSHFGAGRAPWLHEVALEVARARAGGVPVEGICLYPILDRPDWDDSTHWHNSGLWDLVPDAAGTLRRVRDKPYAEALRVAQRLLPL